MRIVNLAHGNLYAVGAYATAWAVGRMVGGGQPSLMLYLLLPVGAVTAAALGAILEPTLLRPLYKRAEEYQLLITFGLLLILEDLLRFIWGPYPLSASSLFEALGSLSIGESVYPAYNLVVIVVGCIAAATLWALIYKTRFGVILRATSQNMRMASALGVNVNRVYLEAFTLGCFMAGLGGAIIVPQHGAVWVWAWTFSSWRLLSWLSAGSGVLRVRSSGSSWLESFASSASPFSQRLSWPSSISWQPSSY